MKGITKLFFTLSVSLVLITAQTVSVLALEPANEPIGISIPSINITLPVVPVPIVDDTWAVSETAASFGENTTLPGDNGNTVIFAHARQPLFGKLPNIKDGAYIHVFTKNDWFIYQVTERKIVEPTDTSILEIHNKHELTLYTCTVEKNAKRFSVKAILRTYYLYN